MPILTSNAKRLDWLDMGMHHSRQTLAVMRGAGEESSVNATFVGFLRGSFSDTFVLFHHPWCGLKMTRLASHRVSYTVRITLGASPPPPLPVQHVMHC